MWLQRVEYSLLILAAFSLALFEAPKTIFFALYALVWVGSRAWNGNWGGPWRGWDTVAVVFLGSVAVATSFAGMHGREFGGLVDVFTYLLIFVLVSRSQYSERQIAGLLFTLFLSASLGLAEVYWQPMVSHEAPRLELNSVGHVNHTAIYLALLVALLAALVGSWWRRLSGLWLVAGLVLLGFYLVAVINTSSRAALLAVIVLLALYAVHWMRTSWAAFWSVLVILAGAIAIPIVMNADIVTESQTQWQANIFMKAREGLWNVALEAWRQFPWFGIGSGNFRFIDQAVVDAWTNTVGAGPERPYYHYLSHVHSLYLGRLAENGVVGFAGMMMFLLYWAYRLKRDYPRVRGDNYQSGFWLASLGALTVNLVVGVFNTTLHHEHAMLSVIILALWVMQRPARLGDQA